MTEQLRQKTAQLETAQVLEEGGIIQGTLKFFKWKGYGFIVADYHNGREVYLKYCHVPPFLRPYLTKGTRFYFITRKTKKGIYAIPVGLVDDEEEEMKAAA